MHCYNDFMYPKKLPLKPYILNHKLEIGNKEQIEAIREYESLLKKYNDSRKLSIFRCEISISGSKTLFIRAKNKAEVNEIIDEMMTNDLDEVEDFSIDYIEKVKDVG